MFQRIIKLALSHRVLVMVFALGIIILGVMSLQSARYDVYPAFIQPQLKIKTLAPGYSASQVEKLVTAPIERTLSGGVGAVQIQSNSLQGISVVKVLFPGNSNIYRDQQMVSARLAAVAGELPPGVHAPVLRPLSASIRWVAVAAITGKGISQRHLRTVAVWQIKPALLGVPGVAQVAVFGGQSKEYQFRLRPRRLIALHLSLSQVLRAARGATAIAGEGFIDTPNQRLDIRVHGQARTLRQFAQSVIATRHGAPITLGAVSTAVAGHAPIIGQCHFDGHPAVLMMVGITYGANLLTTSRQVQHILAAFRVSLAKVHIHLHPKILDSAQMVHLAMHNLLHSLLIGAILVAIVLLLFLGHWRTAVISCVAIPISFCAAIIILVHFGETINIMTLGGLAIAIGEVVDDAVIDVENVTRRLRLNRAVNPPLPAWRVVLNASLEIRTSVVYATIAVVLVFIPVYSLGGIAGRFFQPMALAYMAAVGSSLVVALTLTPVLSWMLLGTPKVGNQDARVARGIKAAYSAILRPLLRLPILAVGAVAISILAAGLLAIRLKPEFLPRLNEQNYVVHLALTSGSSFAQSMAIGDAVTRRLLKFPAVRQVEQRSGRADYGGDVLGPQYSEFMIKIKSLSPHQALIFRHQMQHLVKEFPGVLMSFNSTLTERINETLSGSGAPVVLRVVGADLTHIQQATTLLVRALRKVPGAGTVIPQTPWFAPRITIRLHRGRLAQWGLTPRAAMDIIPMASDGLIVGHIYHSVRIRRVVLRLPGIYRHSVAALKRMPIPTPDGYIRLGAIARIRQTVGFYRISDFDSQRAQMINIHLHHTTAGAFVAAAKAAIRRLKLPSGIHLQFAGSAAAQQKAMSQLLGRSLLVILLIVVILNIPFGSWPATLLLLVNLPLAFLGGLIAIKLTGHRMSLGALVGLITLMGITMRNGIMLLCHYRHLVQVEGRSWNRDTALEGAVDRIPAILMTALIAIAGLLPLALGAGSPGQEIEGPLAIVVVGGVITSTLLNLFIVPILAARFCHFAPADNPNLPDSISAPAA